VIPVSFKAVLKAIELVAVTFVGSGTPHIEQSLRLASHTKEGT
jgi:hypothetical protein